MRLKLWAADGADAGHISGRDARRMINAGEAYPRRDGRSRLIGVQRRLGRQLVISSPCITVAESEAAIDGCRSARDKIAAWAELQRRNWASLGAA